MNSLEKKITPGFLLRFTLPTVVMMVFNSFYTMVDGGFVSRFVGTGALSAVNIVYPALNLVFALGIMLATGGSAVVAKLLGEGREEHARRSFTTLVVVALALGGGDDRCRHAAGRPGVRMLGANDAVFAYCRDYMFTLSLFVPFAMLQLLFQYFFVAAARPNLGLISTVAGGVANIVLDYVFIVPLKMGVTGAALATGLGFVIPAVVGLVFFACNRKGRCISPAPVGAAAARLCLRQRFVRDGLQPVGGRDHLFVQSPDDAGPGRGRRGRHHHRALLPVPVHGRVFGLCLGRGAPLQLQLRRAGQKAAGAAVPAQPHLYRRLLAAGLGALAGAVAAGGKRFRKARRAGL